MSIRKNKQYPGTFVVIEGVDGAGKTTVVGKLEYILKQIFSSANDEHDAREVVRVRAPSGAIRDILLNREFPLTDEQELLLYVACHADLVSSQILPALQRGAIVLCDRFTFSTMAYQGFGRKLLGQVDDLLNNYLKPPVIDHLVFVQADELTCMERLRLRGNMDFMDSLQEEIRLRIRNGMLSLMEFEEKNRRDGSFSRILNNSTEERLTEMCHHWVNFHFLGIDDRR